MLLHIEWRLFQLFNGRNIQEKDFIKLVWMHHRFHLNGESFHVCNNFTPNRSHARFKQRNDAIATIEGRSYFCQRGCSSTPQRKDTMI